ncbi:MAG: hypothetical protein L3K06_01355 [Thermoplasmata archaeon]|nr:hypothetical protein [Thermoplasmata archaeon]MCI4353997.1 hypothetical protein [Thermoplasmata archaeon]
MHARANALTLTTELSGAALLKSLHGVAPDISFTAARPVSPGFSVRTAAYRWYRHFEPVEGQDLARWSAAAARFHGYVDVRSFGRDVPAADPTWRKLDSVRVTRRGPLLMVDLRAPSFVWGMVRKIVGALRLHAEGRLPLDQLSEAIDGKRRLTLPLADPERLVLWEVHYDGGWEIRVPESWTRAARAMERAREAAEVRASILRALWPTRRAAGRPRTREARPKPRSHGPRSTS